MNKFLDQMPANMKPANFQGNPEEQKQLNKKLKSMQKKNRPWGKFLAFLLILGGVIYATHYFEIWAIYEAKIEVVSKEQKVDGGFDGQVLDFGRISENEMSQVNLSFENKSKYVQTVYVYKTGKIAPHVKFSQEQFLVARNEVKTIFAYTLAGSYDLYGKYTGRIIVFRIPKLW